MKTQDVFALVGGFVNGVMIILTVIMSSFRNVFLNKIIFSNIFELNSPYRPDRGKKTIIDVSAFKSINLDDKSVSRIDVSNQNLSIVEDVSIKASKRIVSLNETELLGMHIGKGKKDEEANNANSPQIIKALPSKTPIQTHTHSKFDPSYWIFIKHAFCRKWTRDMMLGRVDYAEHYITKRIDLSFYFRLLENFDNLTRVLLTREQRLLFKFDKKADLKFGYDEETSRQKGDQRMKELMKFVDNAHKINDPMNLKIAKFARPLIDEYKSNASPQA